MIINGEKNEWIVAMSKDAACTTRGDDGLEIIILLFFLQGSLTIFIPTTTL